MVIYYFILRLSRAVLPERLPPLLCRVELTTYLTWKHNFYLSQAEHHSAISTFLRCWLVDDLPCNVLECLHFTYDLLLHGLVGSEFCLYLIYPSSWSYSHRSLSLNVPGQWFFPFIFLLTYYLPGELLVNIEYETL